MIIQQDHYKYHYKYHKDHYKLIAIDLSKQTELEYSDLKQQINFIGRLEEKKCNNVLHY